MLYVKISVIGIEATANCSTRVRARSPQILQKGVASDEHRTDAAQAHTRSPMRSCGCTYDYYSVLDETLWDELRVAALVHDPQSGRSLEVSAMQAGVGSVAAETRRLE